MYMYTHIPIIIQGYGCNYYIARKNRHRFKVFELANGNNNVEFWQSSTIRLTPPDFYRNKFFPLIFASRGEKISVDYIVENGEQPGHRMMKILDRYRLYFKRTFVLIKATTKGH